MGSEMAAPVAQSCESVICNYNHKIIKLAQTWFIVSQDIVAQSGDMLNTAKIMLWKNFQSESFILGNKFYE